MRYARLILAALLLGLVGMGASFAQATQLVFTTVPSGAAPGQPFITQPVVQAQDASGAIDTTFNGPVTITINPASAAGNVSLLGTVTVNAVNGEADFTNLAINIPGSYLLTATSGTLTGGTSVAVVDTLADVWSINVPATNDQTQTVSGNDQIRAFAVNSNPGSAYKGTMYLSRRSTSAASTADVFFWRGTATNAAAVAGSGTLKPAGPDYSHPDGRFNLTGVTPGGNAFWPISVAGDDLVYVSGLTSGTLIRFKPDGTAGTQMTLTNAAGATLAFPRTRQFYATGSGANTAIYLLEDKSNPVPVEKWTVTASDATGPTAFKQTVLFNSNDPTNQSHQLLINNAGDTIYFTAFASTGSVPTPRKYSIAGVPDTTFPSYTLSNGSGLAIDSQDRIIYQAYPYSKLIVAMSPRNGVNLTDKADGSSANNGSYFPTGFVGNYGNQYMELQRYSDRHYFVLGNDVSSGSVSTAVFSTTMPAPSPSNIHVADTGQGGSTTVTFTVARDPEVTGVNIYRSATSGPVASKTKVGSNISGGTFTDTGLTNGTTYYYTVRSAALDPFTGTSYEGASELEYTGVPTANAAPPAAPTGLVATNLTVGGSIKLTYVDPTSATLDHINVYRSTASGTLGTLIGTAAKGAQTYTDNTAVNGTAYYYTVKAANGAGAESAASAQVTATATDTTAPTFAGIKGFNDYGLPGLRLNWNPATDNSSPITYLIYTSATANGFNFTTPTATTTSTTYDLSGLPLGVDVFVIVRARDAVGNTDTNTKIVAATPSRVIVDSDINAQVNFDKFNPQPDPNFAALVPVGVGAAKGSQEPDLVHSAFAAGVYYNNNNTHLGKSSYTLPINTVGNYEIDAYWAPDNNNNTPNYTFHITFPDGTTQDVVVDQTHANSGHWNALVASKDLTVGNLVVIGDATTSTVTDAASFNESDAIRALLTIAPKNVNIYRAASPIVVDGQATGNEYAGAPVLTLGRAFQDVIGGNYTGPSDYSASVQFKYDANNLYFLAQISDDVVSFPTTTDAQLYNRDAIELNLGGLVDGLDPARTTYNQTGGDYQILFSATQGATASDLTPDVYSPYTATSGITVSTVKTAAGFNIEASIPFASLDGSTFAPAINKMIGFNLVGDDNDQVIAGQDSAFSFSGKAGYSSNPQAFITATFLGLPVLAVKGDVDGNGTFDANDVKLLIRMVGGLVPSTATAVQNGDVAGSGADGRTADGKLTLADAARLNRVLNGKDSLP